MLSYAVTDPSTLSFGALKRDIERFAKRADIITYRDKKTQTYNINAKLFIQEARKYPFQKILLHQDILLAIELKSDGVHLTSQQFNSIEMAKEANLFVVISTHSYVEAKLAEELGADMVTFSPIFSTPNKGEAVGLDALREVTERINIPVIALGGIISQEHIDRCQKSGAYGFASIRYFI